MGIAFTHGDMSPNRVERETFVGQITEVQRQMPGQRRQAREPEETTRARIDPGNLSLVQSEVDAPLSLAQSGGGRRARPAQIEIHLARPRLDELGVPQLLECTADVVARNAAFQASQPGVLAAPFTLRVDRESRRLHLQ